MSICSDCLQGFCRRHPLQDHGKRAAAFKDKVKEIRKSNFNSQIQERISQLQTLTGPTIDDIESYKKQMASEREKAENRDRKTQSYSSKEKELLAKTSGLNPSVLSIMLAESDDDDHDSPNNDINNANKKRKTEKKIDDIVDVNKKKKKKEKKKKSDKSKESKKSNR